MYYFVDLDGTLKTDRDYLGGEILTPGGNHYGYIVRPHALKFLQGLSELGHVFIIDALPENPTIFSGGDEWSCLTTFIGKFPINVV